MVVFYLLLIVLADFYTTNLTADCFRKFFYELDYTRIFIGRSHFLHVILQFFD